MPWVVILLAVLGILAATRYQLGDCNDFGAGCMVLDRWTGRLEYLRIGPD